MKLAREKSLEDKGQKVHIFPDLTADVLNQRHCFAAIKRKCKSHGVKYVFCFLATPIITAKEDETKTFDTPKDAESYLSRAVDKWSTG